MFCQSATSGKSRWHFVHPKVALREICPASSFRRLHIYLTKFLGRADKLMLAYDRTSQPTHSIYETNYNM